MTDAKLACKNIWKVFGAQKNAAPRDLIDPAGDASAQAQALRDRGHIVAAADVSFEVQVGEIFVIMGLSGSGKSTLVRCLSRLVEPTAGAILLDGDNLLTCSRRDLIDYRRRKMGMVFQNFGLMPHLNVLDNVAFPLELQGLAKDERRRAVQEVIDLVGLTGREASFPHQLSGGQQQRVGIARSLVVKPELWFLDEPFSALDPLIRRQMQDEFLRLQRELNKTIVFITHDFMEALRIADRMAIMRAGEIVQIGRPVDVILHPADAYVRDFTLDVPRERVLTAGHLADPAKTGGHDGAPVSGQTPLIDLLPLLRDQVAGLRVQDADGQDLGGVDAYSVITALARGDAPHGQEGGA